MRADAVGRCRVVRKTGRDGDGCFVGSKVLSLGGLGLYMHACS
jgi:hypothetical protein